MKESSSWKKKVCAWLDRENRVRKIGYGILIADVIIAGFINF